MSRYFTSSPASAALFPLIIVLFFSSCDKEEVEKGKELRVTIDLTRSYSSTYYFLSDEDGNLIDLQQAGNGNSIELKSEKPYRHNTYSLTVFDVNIIGGETHFAATTYAGINTMQLSWKAAGFNLDYDNTYFSYSGLGNQSTGVVSTDASAQQVTTLGGGSGQLGSYGNTTKLLAVVQDFTLTQPRFRLFDNGGNGFVTGNINNPHLIDLSLVTEPLPTRRINIPAEASRPFVTVYGIKNNGTTPEYYRIAASLVFVDPAVIADPGNAFDGYFYNTNFTINKYTYTNSRSSIEFSPMPVSINLVERSANTATFSTTGDYDYGMLRFVSMDKPYYWDIYFPPSSDTRTVNFPKVPAELLEKFGSSPMGNLDLSSFTATDFKDVGGYEDFLLKHDQTDMFRQEAKNVRIYAIDMGG